MCSEIITQKDFLLKEIELKLLMKTLFGSLCLPHLKCENIYSWKYLVPTYHFKGNEPVSPLPQTQC